MFFPQGFPAVRGPVTKLPAGTSGLGEAEMGVLVPPGAGGFDFGKFGMRIAFYRGFCIGASIWRVGFGHEDFDGEFVQIGIFGSLMTGDSEDSSRTGDALSLKGSGRRN